MVKMQSHKLVSFFLFIYGNKAVANLLINFYLIIGKLQLVDQFYNVYL